MKRPINGIGLIVALSVTVAVLAIMPEVSALARTFRGGGGAGGEVLLPLFPLAGWVLIRLIGNLIMADKRTK